MNNVSMKVFTIALTLLALTIGTIFTLNATNHHNEEKQNLSSVMSPVPPAPKKKTKDSVVVNCVGAGVDCIIHIMPLPGPPHLHYTGTPIATTVSVEDNYAISAGGDFEHIFIPDPSDPSIGDGYVNVFQAELNPEPDMCARFTATEDTDRYSTRAAWDAAVASFE